MDAYFDLRISSPDMLSIHDIPVNLPSLSAQHMQCLARAQLRALPTDGGLDLPAMSDIAIPAFYAAHTRHLRQLLQEGVPGPFLLPEASPSPSSCFFSEPFYQAQHALTIRGAAIVRTETDIHPPLCIPDMILPNGIIFQDLNVASAVKGVSTLLRKVTNQKYLSQWYRTASPDRQDLLRLCQAYPPLATRLAHLSPARFTGGHKPFDLPHKLVFQHQPNAFLKTFLPIQEDTMSQHQLGLFLKLLLGLPIPALLQSASACPCGLQHDFFGYHRLNCKQNAGRANRAAHDLVQMALKKEFQRLGLSVVDNDHDMRQRFAHLSSQKRGDLAILSTSNYLIYDQISCQPRSQAIADIKMVSLVNSQGTWSPAISRHKNKLENPSLVQQEHIKDRKHAAFYAPLGFSFFAFVVSCFGSLGPTAVRCLFSLADLELRQHDSSLARQGLPPLSDPSARSQFRAIAYRQISARIGIAVAKASVMRLLGVPRLPLPPFLPRAALARNRPGPADSFSPPVPLSYASSLSLPSASSQSVSSFSPALSP
jgi:hypothetical protein